MCVPARSPLWSPSRHMTGHCSRDLISALSLPPLQMMEDMVSTFGGFFVQHMVEVVADVQALLDPDNDILIVRGPIAHACDTYVTLALCGGQDADTSRSPFTWLCLRALYKGGLCSALCRFWPSICATCTRWLRWYLLFHPHTKLSLSEL